MTSSEHDREEIFDAISSGDLKRVLELVEGDRDLLEARNMYGAAPVHAAYLEMKYDIGEALVARYPEYADLQYAPGHFAGENILHIAIVQRAFLNFEWLLERHPELLDGETTGKFFTPGDTAYFGGFPLLFAVATNQSEMVEKILAVRKFTSEKGTLACCDRYGNTALHMAVIHDLPDMYNFIVETESKLPLPNAVPLAQRVNREGLTPYAMAAVLGRVVLFRKMLHSNLQLSWEYGPVKCIRVPLRGLDQPVITTRPDGSLHPSNYPLVLRCLCAGARSHATICLKAKNSGEKERAFKGRLALMKTPEIKLVLDKKWANFGWPVFKKKFIVVCAVLVFWTTAIIIPYGYNENPDFISQYPINNAFIILFQAMVLIYVIWTVGTEALRLFHAGRNYFAVQYGVVNIMYWLKMIFCLLVLVLVGLRAGQVKYGDDVVTSLASVVGWIYLLVHMVAFLQTGPFIIGVQQMIMDDIRKFGMVFFIVLFGYCTGIYLVRECDEKYNSVQCYFINFRDLVIIGSVGEFVFEAIDEGPVPWLFNVLLVSYFIFQTIIMMNILIAMITDTYASVESESECLWYVERNNLMTFFESELSIHDMYNQRKKYAKPLQPSQDEEFDADLFLEIETINEQWKLDVAKQQLQLVEQRQRAAVAEEELDDWEDIHFRSTLTHADIVDTHVPWTLRHRAKKRPSRENALNILHECNGEEEEPQGRSASRSLEDEDAQPNVINIGPNSAA